MRLFSINTGGGSSGGGAVWGSITGTLSDQVDLQAALDAKISNAVSSTDNAHARWSGASGDTLQDGKWIEDDDGHVTVNFGDTGSTSTRYGWYPTITLDGGTASSINAVERFDISTEGSGAGAFLMGSWIRLLAGYTGNGLTAGQFVFNQVAGTGTNLNSGQGNHGYRVLMGQATSGHVAGYYVSVGGANGRSWGGLAEVEANPSSGVGIGWGGIVAAGSGTYVCAPIVGIIGAVNSAPNASAAGYFDNGSSTHPGLLVRDNGTTMFLVADGGACTLGAASTTPTHRLNTATQGSAGASSGTFLVININGTDYCVDLLATS